MSTGKCCLAFSLKKNVLDNFVGHRESRRLPK